MAWISYAHNFFRKFAHVERNREKLNTDKRFLVEVQCVVLLRLAPSPVPPMTDPDPFHILAPHALTWWAEVALLECSGHAGWQVWGQDTQDLAQAEADQSGHVADLPRGARAWRFEPTSLW